MADHEDYLPGETPAAHAATHENGGVDEIDVTGLEGLYTDARAIAVANGVWNNNFAIAAVLGTL